MSFMFFGNSFLQTSLRFASKLLATALYGIFWPGFIHSFAILLKVLEELVKNKILQNLTLLR